MMDLGLAQDGLQEGERVAVRETDGVRRSWGRYLRILVLSSLVVALTFLVVTYSLPAYLAETAPETALKLQPSEPLALISQAQICLETARYVQAKGRQPAPDTLAGSKQDCALIGSIPDLRAATSPPPKLVYIPDAKPLLEGSPSESYRLEAIRLARTAALVDPLNARPLVVIGEASDMVHDGETSYRAMAAAATRSKHETEAWLWLLQSALMGGRYSEAATRIDVLLRLRPQLVPYIVPAMAFMAEKDEGRDDILKLLVGRPPWRSQFFESMPQSVSKLSTPKNLLLALKATEAPPTLQEATAYLRFLVGKKLYSDGYEAWLDRLSAEQLARTDYIYDGGFDTIPGQSPFDWRIASGRGYRAEVTSDPSNGELHGLRLEFDGFRTEFQPVTQLVILPPGSYTFTGKWSGSLIGPRGLVWRVTCVDKSSLLGSSPMLLGAAGNGTEFGFSFSVPESDCDAQTLSLVLDARSPSESIVKGAVWFRSLEMRRSVDLGQGDNAQ